MGQPPIGVIGLEREQVFLLSSATHQFCAALNGNRDKTFDPLLPYAALLKNGAEKTIVAYSVWWNFIDVNGEKGNPAGVVIFDFDNVPPSRTIPPEGTRVVAPAPMLALIRTGLRAGPSMLRHMQGLLGAWQERSCIAISIDAVLFDDGATVGPDRHNQISLWRADNDARRDIYAEVVCAGRAAFTSILKAAISRAQALISWTGERAPDFHRLGSAAVVDFATYEDRYTLLRGALAGWMMHMIGSEGEEKQFRDAVRKASQGRIKIRQN